MVTPPTERLLFIPSSPLIDFPQPLGPNVSRPNRIDEIKSTYVPATYRLPRRNKKGPLFGRSGEKAAFKGKRLDIGSERKKQMHPGFLSLSYSRMRWISSKTMTTLFLPRAAISPGAASTCSSSGLAELVRLTPNVTLARVSGLFSHDARILDTSMSYKQVRLLPTGVESGPGRERRTAPSARYPSW